MNSKYYRIHLLLERSSDLSPVFTLQAAYFSLAFFLLLLRCMPMSWKTLKHIAQSKITVLVKIRKFCVYGSGLTRLQMVVKCKPCLNQFHSMLNNCHFNKSVGYLIIAAKRNPTTRDVQ